LKPPLFQSFVRDLATIFTSTGIEHLMTCIYTIALMNNNLVLGINSSGPLK